MVVIFLGGFFDRVFFRFEFVLRLWSLVSNRLSAEEGPTFGSMGTYLDSEACSSFFKISKLFFGLLIRSRDSSAA